MAYALREGFANGKTPTFVNDNLRTLVFVAIYRLKQRQPMEPDATR